MEKTVLRCRLVIAQFRTIAAERRDPRDGGGSIFIAPWEPFPIATRFLPCTAPHSHGGAGGQTARADPMNGLIYLIGLIVVIMAILSFLPACADSATEKFRIRDLHRHTRRPRAVERTTVGLIGPSNGPPIIAGAMAAGRARSGAAQLRARRSGCRSLSTVPTWRDASFALVFLSGPLHHIGGPRLLWVRPPMWRRGLARPSGPRRRRRTSNSATACMV